jgi:hypothetical protein
VPNIAPALPAQPHFSDFSGTFQAFFRQPVLAWIYRRLANEVHAVLDFAFVAATLGFFATSLGYVAMCHRLMK